MSSSRNRKRRHQQHKYNNNSNNISSEIDHHRKDNKIEFKRVVAPERPENSKPIDYSGRHPFELVEERERKRNRKRNRQQQQQGLLVQEEKQPLNFEPIRVLFDDIMLREDLNNELILLNGGEVRQSTMKKYLLLYKILPKASSILSDIIRVIPVQGALYPLSSASAAAMEDENDTINRELYCPSDHTSGVHNDADLLVYVTLDKFNCHISNDDDSIGKKFSTAASALSCERDQYDRPITGRIDFCLDAMGYVEIISNLQEVIAAKNVNNDDLTSSPLELSKNNEAIVENIVEVAMHELLHVLGLTSASLPFFRHPITGRPLTKRPFRLTKKICANKRDAWILGEPNEFVLARLPSQENSSNNNNNYSFEVRTPLVTQVVRNHFDCPTLTGARLENHPTSGTECFGSHWDERLHYSEVMSAYLNNVKNNNVLSPLTLAFLEDSSWYRANYQSRYIQTPSFGYLSGCDFVNKPCIVDGDVPSYSVGNFCNRTSEVTCDPTYTHKTKCDLRDYDVDRDDPLPLFAQQYFPDDAMKRPREFVHAEYCPIPSLEPSNCMSMPSIPPPTRNEYRKAGERYGPSSRCVDVVTRNDSICLEALCNSDIGKLQLIVRYGLRITCQYDGEIHTLFGSSSSSRASSSKQRQPFQIQCPRAAQICPNMICSKNCSGRGKCITSTGRCQCYNTSDHSAGCYHTNLATAYSVIVSTEKNNPYHPFYHVYADYNRQNQMETFLLIMTILILTMILLFVLFPNNKRRVYHHFFSNSNNHRERIATPTQLIASSSSIEKKINTPTKGKYSLVNDNSDSPTSNNTLNLSHSWSWSSSPIR